MNTKPEQLSERIMAGRILFSRAYIHFRDGIYRAKFQANPELAPTIAIDKHWRMYYNPEWFDNLGNARQVVFALYHEIMHKYLKHFERMQGRIPLIWNFAADLEINTHREFEIENWGYESECPIEIPKGILLPQQFHFPKLRTAEEYYDMLMKNAKGGSGSEGPVIQLPNGCDPCSGFCGEGDPEDGEGKVGEAEGELLRNKAAREFKPRSRGTTPADVARFVENILNPVVDWRRELRASVRNAAIKIAGRADYTFAKPGRKSPAGMTLPGMMDALPVCAVVVDTSGSMGPNDLEAAMAETNGILRAYAGKFFVHFLSCDSEIGKVQKIFNPKQVSLIGGGGTDMSVGIRQAMELRPRPDLIVVCTDGYTPWPDHAPKARVIVACTTEEKTPDWAKTVRIARQEKGR